MATLQEYYKKDIGKFFSMNSEWTITSSNGLKHVIIPGVHQDFEMNTKFISFYVPFLEDNSIFITLIQKHELAVKIADGVHVESRYVGTSSFKSDETVFSGRIIFYYEGIIDENWFLQLQEEAKKIGLFISYRDLRYAKQRSDIEHPLAFISHDSRDKSIASEIANELQKRACPIWYDEYSLKLGDSLRESIEKGLKECKKCVLILSQNFLKNSGWTKTEFNTIFTREILESGGNLILPIWVGVSKNEIYEYCPTIVDRVGVKWEKGIEYVGGKIQQSIYQE